MAISNTQLFAGVVLIVLLIIGVFVYYEYSSSATATTQPAAISSPTSTSQPATTTVPIPQSIPQSVPMQVSNTSPAVNNTPPPNLATEQLNCPGYTADQVASAQQALAELQAGIITDQAKGSAYTVDVQSAQAQVNNIMSQLSSACTVVS